MMDQLYNDFVTQLLPKVQEGLMITQEYFVDLFGRYIKFLIITDLINIALAFIVTGLMWWGWKVALKVMPDREDWNMEIWPIFVVTLGAFATVMIGLFCYEQAATSVIDLAKAIYIPEVRVYEELRGMDLIGNKE